MSKVERQTVAVLYPGELGTALGALLVRRGHRIVTTLAGRGEATRRRCGEAGIEALPSLADAARAASVTISLVPPAVAEATAAQWCALAPARSLYVDANSIGARLAASIAERVTSSGHAFVDAAINGLAKNLTSSATLFLSGSRADEVATLVGDDVRVRLLGDRPGRASAMKMLLSGLSKGACALFVETALLAQREGMLPEMVAAYREIYPGVMAIIDRMLPTYAKHAARRATETRELEDMAAASGLDAPLLAAVRAEHERLAEVALDPTAQWGVTELIEQIAAEEFSPAGGAPRRPQP